MMLCRRPTKSLDASPDASGERVSQLIRSGGGCFDSRRLPANSNVRRRLFFGREHGNRIQPTHRFYNSTGTAVIMRGKKILVTIIALALLLACIVALRLRRDQPVAPRVSETSRLIGGPAFEVQVEMPAFNSGRAPWEIPGVILGYDRGPRFDQTSPGAQVGKIASDHIELSSDGGWD